MKARHVIVCLLLCGFWATLTSNVACRPTAPDEQQQEAGDEPVNTKEDPKTDASSPDPTPDQSNTPDPRPDEPIKDEPVKDDPAPRDEPPQPDTPPNPDAPPPQKCNNPATPPASGLCTVTKGDKTVVIQANILMPSGFLEQGQVAIQNEKIVCVGCDCATQYTSATKLVCPEAVLSPGLINAHDHLAWAIRGPGKYTSAYDHRHEWRKGAGPDKPKVSAGGQNSGGRAVAWGEIRMMMSGVTSIAGNAAATGLIRNLVSKREGLPGTLRYTTFPLGDSGGDLISSGCKYPKFDSKSSIDKATSYIPHVAEGISDAARNEFLCMTDAANGGQSLLSQNASIIHGIGLTATDISLMAQRGINLIWSARTNVSLYGHTANVTLFDRYKVKIALGTDWMPSGSMNMVRELQCVDYLNKNHYNSHFTDQQIIAMATSNAADVLGVGQYVGSIKVGYYADLALYDAKNNKGYRAIIDSKSQDIALVMRGGRSLYGNKALIEALAETPANCDAIDVCSSNKLLCLADEKVDSRITNLKDLMDYVNTWAPSQNVSVYPLFSCDATPKDEPSCVPQKKGQFGMSDPNDKDGDGIENSKDNCPDIFNPIRPLDNGKQADADDDGKGDVCDVCPLTKDSTTCKGFDPNDRDGDGIENSKDNCPFVSNPDQKDEDKDTTGDACDPCPKDANKPGEACPVKAASIYDLKSGKIALNNNVRLENLLITAIQSNKERITAQLIPGDTGYQGADYSGIMIYVGTSPSITIPAGIKVGDRMTVEGKAAEFSGQIQLSNLTTLTITPGTTQAPAVTVKPADINKDTASRAKALEGVVVKVENVEVTNENPDDPNQYGEYSVAATGALTDEVRVDDLFDAAVTTAATRAKGTKYTSITGVLLLTFGNYKIIPRSASELVK